MKTITDEEYEHLVQAANAWKDFTKRRVLDGPYAIEELHIVCLKGSAHIKVVEGVIQTPYGHIRRADGKEYHVHTNDSLYFKREVNLTFN